MGDEVAAIAALKEMFGSTTMDSQLSVDVRSAFDLLGQKNLDPKELFSVLETDFQASINFRNKRALVNYLRDSKGLIPIEKFCALLSKLVSSAHEMDKNQDGKEAHDISNEFAVGDRVEARFRGNPRKKFYSGCIASVHVSKDVLTGKSEKLYDIDYDDGDKDKRLRGNVIRALVSNMDSNLVVRNHKPKFAIGAKVEARFRGNPRKRFYPGVVVAVHETSDKFYYDIDYDDGDEDKGLPEETVKEVVDTKHINVVSKGPLFKRNQHVEARLHGRPGAEFSRGVISSIHESGDSYVYDVDYDDGDMDKGIPEMAIKSITASSRNAAPDIPIDTKGDALEQIGQIVAPPFTIGQRVEAKFRGNPKKKFYPGKVSKIHQIDPVMPGGPATFEFDIDYDDGDKDKHISANVIRPLELPPTDDEPSEDSAPCAATAAFKVGDLVRARFRGNPRKKFYDGKIAAIHTEDGRSGTATFSYDVDYDDGDKDKGLMKDVIELRDASVAPSTPSSNTNPKYNVGDIVEARFRGNPRKRYYRGVISAAYKTTEPSGETSFRYDIDYDDGDKDRKLSSEAIRRTQDVTSSQTQQRTIQPLKDVPEDEEPSDVDETKVAEKSSVDLTEGIRVEAHFRGNPRKKMYPGVISRINRTRDILTGVWKKSYDIAYDDGDFDRGLSAAVIKVVSENSNSNSAVKDIKKANSKTTAMRSEIPDVRTRKIPKFRRGDQIESQMRGASTGQFYAGTITRVHVPDDNSQDEIMYDIHHDNGVKSSKVNESVVRAKTAQDLYDVMDSKTDETKRQISSPAGTLNEPLAQAEYAVGDTVEARFRGNPKKKYYKGKIAMVHKSKDAFTGASCFHYDIDYDDGDKDKKLPASVIRDASVVETPTILSAEAEEPQQDPRGRHSSKPEELDVIRSSVATTEYFVGQKVKARFRGNQRNRYYLGTITNIRTVRDPVLGTTKFTYDVEYDDGDKDSSISPSAIAALEIKTAPAQSVKFPVSATDQASKFKAGDYVMAHFRGNPRNARYPGRVTNVVLVRMSEKSTYMYDIDYDDGDKDDRVTEDLLERISPTESLDKTYISFEKARNSITSQGSTTPALYVKVGSRVVHKFTHRTGTITKVSTNAGIKTLDVTFDDGTINVGIDANDFNPFPTQTAGLILSHTEVDKQPFSSYGRTQTTPQSNVQTSSTATQQLATRTPLQSPDLHTAQSWRTSFNVQPLLSEEFGELDSISQYAESREMGPLARDLARLRADLLPIFARTSLQQGTTTVEDIPNCVDPSSLERWLITRFATYDRYKDGTISRDGLASAFARLQVTLTARELRALRSAFRRRDPANSHNHARIMYKKLAKMLGGSYSDAFAMLESINAASQARFDKHKNVKLQRTTQTKNLSEISGQQASEVITNHIDTSAFHEALSTAPASTNSLVNWLRTTASPVERTNLALFLGLISQFEEYTGLEQVGTADRFRTGLSSMSRSKSNDDEVSGELHPDTSGQTDDQLGKHGQDTMIIQLGTQLKVGLRFYV